MNPPGLPSSAIDKILDATLQSLRENNVDLGLEHITKLRSQLNVTSGLSTRQKGGLQYDTMYTLDSVLLADNLKPLGGPGEPDLLQDVVKQFGS